jgi:hypothetical protein
MSFNATRPRTSPDLQLRAYEQAGEYLVWPSAKALDWRTNLWTVSKRGGSEYTVNLSAQTCTCKDFLNRQRPCKHVRLVELYSQAEAPRQPKPQPQPKAAGALAAAETEAEFRARMRILRDRDFPLD